MLMMLTTERFEPCKVCGEASSGWHCGAIVCEACKKFFMRSLNGEEAKYKCPRNRQCVIVRSTRNQCQYCRFQRCKQVGMTNSESPINPTVLSDLFKSIGCYVCGAQASGVHFGAITCEGCKGFFRRSIRDREPEKYECHANGNCQITRNTRNVCRHCRYKQCLKVGMAVSNRRIGRQSNLFKHSLIELNGGGLNDHNDNCKTNSEQNQRPDNNSDTTIVTATATTMTAANYFNFLAAKSEVTITSQVNSAMNYQYPAQQIIAVNRFTTNQYIINTGGQVLLSENLVKLTQDGHYGMNIASCNNNTDLNNSQIGQARNVNELSIFPHQKQQQCQSIEDDAKIDEAIRDLIKTVYTSNTDKKD